MDPPLDRRHLVKAGAVALTGISLDTASVMPATPAALPFSDAYIAELQESIDRIIGVPCTVRATAGGLKVEAPDWMISAFLPHDGVPGSLFWIGDLTEQQISLAIGQMIITSRHVR